jgi:hypothetical protein
MAFVTQQQIFDATNGGLDVIISYFPEAAESAQRPSKKFKLRGNEKTASASLKQITGGVWVVTDFGGDQKPRNCIEVTRMMENCGDGPEGFKMAVNILATRYNVLPIEQQREIFKAERTDRPATDEEEENSYHFEVRDHFTENELKELFAEKVIEMYKHNHQDNWREKLQEVCVKYNFRSLKSFTHIKNRKAFTSTANDNYPIFLIEGDTFKKIYQPKNLDKQYRFRYTGERPKDFIFGYKRLQKTYNDLTASIQNDVEDLDEPGDESKEPPQLEEVIICSGDRDSLNVAALGYNVIWLNSETAHLRPDTMTQLRKMCKSIYNLPDLDATGKKQGHELAMFFLDIKTIWLPEKLREHKDWRGNPCKDLRDFLRFYTKKQFDDLVKTALPYQFWNVEPRYSRDGKKFKGWGYAVNNTHTYNFLMRNGFYRFKIDNEKEGYTYIHIQNNQVKQVKAIDVKGHINEFLEERRQDIELRNAFYKSTQLNETSLSNLKYIDIDFTDFDKDSQCMFFINKTWLITKTGITEYLPSEVSKYVWDTEVIAHRVKLLEKPFTITATTNAAGDIDYDIEIHNTDCLFFRYLINSSRVHWKKELEEGWDPTQEEERLKYIEENKFNIAGSRLNAEEIREQKLHLINKIYSLGYLLHRYKDPSRPWCVFAMDAKISDDGESHGGSGKSIAYNSLTYFMQTVRMDGKNPNLTKNPHVYEQVTKHTDYILIDDCDRYLNFQFFFSPLTGALTVNPKNNKQYTLPYEDVPKFAMTSNFTPNQTDPSTERRILYTVFSDYYHHNSKGEYKESRSPKDDFGKNLFFDFTESEWNLFINTMANCCSWYLNFDKIDPPMNNVEKRNLQTEMGANFQGWADVYFSFENNRLNTFVPKDEAFEDFKNSTNSKLWTPQRFTRSMKAWCRYNRFELDPKEYKNAQGRIIRKKHKMTYDKQGNPTGEKEVSTEMLFVKTTVPETPAAEEEKETLPF